MQIVIDISDKAYGLLKYFEKSLGLNDKKDSNDDLKTALMRAVIHGTPLPKGHGRLIDANSIYQVVRPIEPSDSEWGMTAETAKQIIHDVFDNASTIIEADGAGSEGMNYP